MKPLPLLLLFLLSSLPLFSAVHFTPDEKRYINDHPVIHLGADYKWPPFDFVDKNGNPSGLSVDYLKAIESISGLKFHIHSGKWATIIEKMKKGSFDGLSCAVKTKERTTYLRFSDSYLSVPLVIIVKKESKIIKSLEEIGSLTVSINRGSYVHEWLKSRYPSIKLVLSDSNEASLEKVSLGKADAYVGNLAVSTYIIHKYILNNLKISAKLSHLTTDLSIAIDKNNPTLFSIIQKSLRALEEKEIEKIKTKWIAFSENSLHFTQKEKEWIENHSTLRYVIDNTWEPIEYLSKKGKYSGIVSSYIKLLSQKTGIKLIRVPTSQWSESVTVLNSQKADMYTCVSPTSSREKRVNFTVPYLVMPQVFVTRNDETVITGFDQLSEKTVVLIKGYAVTEKFKKNVSDFSLYPRRHTYASL